jgi:hypothetical protein
VWIERNLLAEGGDDLGKMTFMNKALLIGMGWCLLTYGAEAEPLWKINHASTSKLPSGDGWATGLAGKSLADKPALIFADDFESSELGVTWDEVGNPAGKVLALTDPKLAALGKQCLRVEAHLGKDTGGGLTKWFTSHPTLFIRFYTKFDEQCDYVHHFVTLRANAGSRGKDKWSGFGGAGLKPTGLERFSTAVEPWGDWGKFPAPGTWDFYSYWHEMEVSKDGKYWGNLFLPEDPKPIAKGAWTCVELMLKHNTPNQPDGEQAFWIDGKLRGHWKGISWRKSETLMANALTLESYVTDRWTKQEINVVYFDAVIIAKEYIGPVIRNER